MSARIAVLFLAACGLVSVVLLAGCTAGLGSDGDVSTSATVAPETASTPVARAETMEQWLGVVAGCLQERGWDARVDGTGRGIEMDVLPAEQRDAFDADNVACEATAGIAPNALPPSEEQIRAQYHHLVDSVECIRSLGFDVMESTPPSEETFIDDYQSGNAPWSPFVNLPEMSQSDWERVNTECPQTIDGL